MEQYAFSRYKYFPKYTYTCLYYYAYNKCAVESEKSVLFHPVSAVNDENADKIVSQQQKN
jgi:hypothetical protein